MAEVKFSGLGVVDMNGSVGNTTFARNNYGAYAKARSGAPAGSAFLTAWQANVTALAGTWETGMTDAQRQEWYKIKRIAGDSMADKNEITGYDLYISVNLNLILMLSPTVIVPPASDERLQVTQISFTDTTAINLHIAGTGIPVIPCAIYFTKGLPPGRMSTNQIYAYGGLVGISSFPINIVAQYTARLGVPVVGKKIFVKVLPISQVSGLRGQPKIAAAIVT